jgi:hypothetical protein
LKIVLVEEMPFNFFQKLAVHVDEVAADFTFKMKMFPAIFFVFYVLITGAFVIMQNIFADPSPGGQFFKMPVNGRLPNYLAGVLKMAYYLIDRYMTALEGPHILKDTLSLPGTIICRAFMRHGLYRIKKNKSCQYENEYYFHIEGKFFNRPPDPSKSNTRSLRVSQAFRARDRSGMGFARFCQAKPGKTYYSG